MALERNDGKEVKARWEHICLYCKTVIQKDEIYYYNKYFDKEIWRGEVHKLHLKCVDKFYDQCAEFERYADHWERWHESVFV